MLWRAAFLSSPQAFPCAPQTFPSSQAPGGRFYPPSRPATTSFSLESRTPGAAAALPAGSGGTAPVQSGGGVWGVRGWDRVPSHQGVAYFSPRDLPALRTVSGSAAVKPVLCFLLFPCRSISTRWRWLVTGGFGQTPLLFTCRHPSVVKNEFADQYFFVTPHA